MRRFTIGGTGPATAAALMAALVAVLMSAGSAGAEGGSHKLPKTKIYALGHTVQATQGSYCSRMACADYAYPLHVKCKLPVDLTGVTKINTGARAKSVSVSVVKPAAGSPGFKLVSLETKRSKAKRGQRNFKIQEPFAKVKDGVALDVFVKYKGGGDSDVWAGFSDSDCRAYVKTL